MTDSTGLIRCRLCKVTLPAPGHSSGTITGIPYQTCPSVERGMGLITTSPASMYELANPTIEIDWIAP